ncbi:MAG: FRG domain-containing protein [Spirochaetaceae bacterium]|nr:FRG domain-containing protein [Spirochaetaceae bacterium]
MKELGIINSLEGYIKLIINFYSEERYKKHLFFRGHSSEKFKLLPSVFRKVYDEKDIYLDFMQYAPENNIHYDFIREADKVLADMQHYGLPTRLLDWTVNPLVALFFSCSKDNNNGRVYVFNPWKYNSVISNYKNPKNHETNIYARSLLVYGWDNSTIKKHVKEKYLCECKNSLEKPFAYVSQFTNKRKVSQRGCFLIYGSDKTPFEEIKEAIPYLDYFTIDKDSKENILNELNIFYINDYSVYPDYNGMEKMIKNCGSLFNLNYLKT